ARAEVPIDPALDDAAASFGASVGTVPEPDAGAEPAVQAPAEAAPDEGSAPAVADGPRPNIFMLNDPERTPEPQVGV
ncbi:MAG: hypothetical protein IH621_04355, partial [Krumholzibacteria bacterium]|nr:hypothetical protein [Candidatus Krumholzibacteria bacterium]